MDGSVNSASIATSISIGTSLIAGFFSVLVAMRPRKGAAVHRDTAVAVLFGILLLLILLNVTAAALVAFLGMAYVGLVKAALLLTAAFAVVCVAVGLMRGLRSGIANKTWSA